MGKWTRRAFIGTGALVGGGFVLGVAGVAFSPSRIGDHGRLPCALPPARDHGADGVHRARGWRPC